VEKSMANFGGKACEIYNTGEKIILKNDDKKV
jgi:hypothetical protein